VAAACFFGSGAAALILQVLWARMLGHVLGASALAVSTVLTVFMAGLAGGSHWGGRWAPRMRRPFLVFAALEAFVGLYGLTVPSLLAGVVTLQAAWRIGQQPGWLAGFRFLVCAALLLPPTLAMGATLPALAQGVVTHPDGTGQKVGWLYAANTAGAVAGALAAGFWLIPRWGVTSTVVAAATLDLAVAAVVLVVRPRLRRRARPAPERVNWLEFRPPPEPVTRAGARTTLVAYGLTGAVSMALEVLWTRAVGVVIGSSTYSFTLILSAYLLGLSAGAAAMTVVLPRIQRPMVAVVQLGWTAGAGAVLGTLLVDRLPLFLQAAALQPDVGHVDLFLRSFVATLLVTLPSTLAFGAMMPLALRVLAGNGAPGAAVGRAVAVNTVGAIVGSFAGGFVLLPWLGVEGAILTLGAGLAVAAAGSSWWMAPPQRGWGMAAGAAIVGLALATPGWDTARWTSGLFRMYLARSVYADGWRANSDVIYHRDGIASSVSVTRAHASGSVALKVNGKVDASDRGDMPTQILSGLLPVLLHPDPDDVLIIGYGSGVTPGAVLQAPVSRLVVAEIEARIYEASNRYFAHVNHRPHEDPRAELRVDDGRNQLLLRSDRYDLIISEPSNPWMTGAASLFTQDFFRIVEQRLTEDGLFLQWLQLYELAPDNVATLLRTFQSVFPSVLAFTPNPRSNDLLLIGSRRPIRGSAARWVEAFEDPRLGPELARAGLDGPSDLVGLLVATDHDIRALGPGPINTDDNAWIEFRAPLDLLTYALRDPSIPFIRASDGRRFERWWRLFPDYPRRDADLAWSLLRQGRLTDAHAFAVDAIDHDPRAETVLRLLRHLEEPDREPVLVSEPETRSDRYYAEAAYAMLQERDDEALTRLEQSPVGFEDKTSAHRLLYAYLCYRNGRHVDAEYLFRRVLDDEAFTAQHPAVLYYAGRNRHHRRDSEGAVDLLQRYDRLHRPHPSVAAERAEARPSGHP
jgi:spermidine synthase